PPGSGSFTVTPVASPGPALLTVTVKPIADPADTEAASAVFVPDTLGHCTVSESEGLFPPSLVELIVVVLLYTAHLAFVVDAVTWTLKLPPEARPVGPQASTWLPAAPLTEHSPALDWVSIPQLAALPTLPPGSGSFTVTPVASP